MSRIEDYTGDVPITVATWKLRRGGSYILSIEGGWLILRMIDGERGLNTQITMSRQNAEQMRTELANALGHGAFKR